MNKARDTLRLSDVTFVPQSGATLQELVDILEAKMSARSFDLVILAGFGNEFFPDGNTFDKRNFQDTLESVAKLRRIVPRGVKSLVVYGGRGKLWCPNSSEAALFDEVCAQVRQVLRDEDFETLDGDEDLARFIKNSEFHFSIESKEAIVDTWLSWIA